MTILIEEVQEPTRLIVESGDIAQDKKYFIEGVFMQSDVKNRNGRIYSKDLMDKEITRYINEMVLTKRAVGELGHPPVTQVNADKISHLITDLRIDGNNYLGKAKLLSTPMGLIAQNLVQEGVKFGVSSRGYGSVSKKNGIEYVNKDFRLVTIDIVLDPSAPDAFVTGLMENTDFYLKHGIINEEKIEQFKANIRGLSKSQLNEGKLLDAFQTFLKRI